MKEKSGNGERLARALGWFSLGLGLPQVSLPGEFARAIGLSGDDDSRGLVLLVGVRELIVGAGILRRRRPAGWLWARVAGDVMDLLLLKQALVGRKTDRDRVTAAMVAVAGVLVLDLRCAMKLGRSEADEPDQAREEQAMEVTRSITINRSPDEVYHFWRDFENLPRFMRHLESVEVTGERSSHWKAKAPAGKTVKWDAEIIEDRPGELIAWRSVEGADVDNSGHVSFAAAPGERGTEVQVRLGYNPPGGKVGATLAKLFGEEPGQQIYDDLRALKQVLEIGEVVHSDASIHRWPHAARPPEERARG